MRKPTTGEPYAGKPHVRFGGRGGQKPSLPLSLVGDPETVAARIKEYQQVGIDTFILSGYPHLEEAYRFAELVFPLLALAQAGNVTPLRVNTGPFGETIANEHRPVVKALQS